MSISRPLPPLDDFADLVGSLLDGTITAADHALLDRAIATSDTHRAEYRRMASIESLIAWDRRWGAAAQHAAPAPRCGPLKRAAPWTPAAYSLAAALLLAAAAVAIWLASSNPQSEIRDSQSTTASVLEVSDDATLMIDDQIARPGQEYAGRSISLDGGEAEFMLPGRIAVRLRGATSLTVHDSMSATLERGSAAFDCPHDAKGYTVHMPGGAKVVDLGTRFGVESEENGRFHVYVFEGRVAVEAADGTRRELSDQDTDKAWRFAEPRYRVEPRTVEVAGVGVVTVVPPQITQSPTPRGDGYNTFPTGGDAAFVLPPQSPVLERSDRWTWRPDFMRVEGCFDGSLHAWWYTDPAGDALPELIPLTTRHAVPFGRYAVYAVYAHHKNVRDDLGGITAALHGEELTAFDASNGIFVTAVQNNEWAIRLAPLGQVIGDELVIDIARSRAGLGVRTVYLGLAYRPASEHTESQAPNTSDHVQNN